MRATEINLPNKISFMLSSVKFTFYFALNESTSIRVVKYTCFI
jgi:hypothetical protein